MLPGGSIPYGGGSVNGRMGTGWNWPLEDWFYSYINYRSGARVIAGAPSYNKTDPKQLVGDRE